MGFALMRFPDCVVLLSILFTAHLSKLALASLKVRLSYSETISQGRERLRACRINMCLEGCAALSCFHAMADAGDSLLQLLLVVATRAESKTHRASTAPHKRPATRMQTAHLAPEGLSEAGGI
jgi:hypothetical protein